MDIKIIAAYPGTGAPAFATTYPEVALHWMTENEVYALGEEYLTPVLNDWAEGKIVIVPAYEIVLNLLAAQDLVPLIAVPSDDSFDLYAQYLTVPDPEIYRELWPAVLNNFRYRPNTYVLNIPYAQQLTDVLQLVNGELQWAGEPSTDGLSYNRPDASA